MSKAIMVQGCGSNVGKSMLVAGLCRALLRRGMNVAPFKPQNMSNNAAVTVDGGEIGRAQALQALACGLEPVTDMNPVLLKPENETGAQVVVHGKRIATVKARDYSAMKPRLMGAVLDSFSRLKAAHDLVIVEGAGSPAEINLRPRDIANMGFARAANVPVVLVGDIDRGGVIAQIVGTQAVLDPDDAAMVAGFVINKFRGDPSLFDDGYRQIQARSGWQGYGVLPWFTDAFRLPAEDALDLGSGPVGAVCASPALCFRGLRILTIWTRYRPNRGWNWSWSGPASPSRGMCGLSSCRGRNPRGPIWHFCARKAGTSIWPRMSVAVVMCWASVAGIR